MATIPIIDDHLLEREFLLMRPGYGGHLQLADGFQRLAMVHAAQVVSACGAGRIQ